MSYSRWSHSRWYTFHHVESGATLEEQLFAIYDAAGQTRCYDYETLKGIRLPELAEICGPYLTSPTGEELAELLRYIEAWIQDIEPDPSLSPDQDAPHA